MKQEEQCIKGINTKEYTNKLYWMFGIVISVIIFIFGIVVVCCLFGVRTNILIMLSVEMMIIIFCVVVCVTIATIKCVKYTSYSKMQERNIEINEMLIKSFKDSIYNSEMLSKAETTVIVKKRDL